MSHILVVNSKTEKGEKILKRLWKIEISSKNGSTKFPSYNSFHLVNINYRNYINWRALLWDT